MALQPEPLVDGSRLAELQRQQEAIDASGKERLGNMILAMDEPTEPSSSANDSYTVSEVPEDEDDNVMMVGKENKKALHVPLYNVFIEAYLRDLYPPRSSDAAGKNEIDHQGERDVYADGERPNRMLQKINLINELVANSHGHAAATKRVTTVPATDDDDDE
ncbi:hypothetical protein FOZ62_023506, partial [Perkinsus olseni]